MPQRAKNKEKRWFGIHSGFSGNRRRGA
jgi:hypothetical protein